MRRNTRRIIQGFFAAGALAGMLLGGCASSPTAASMRIHVRDQATQAPLRDAEVLARPVGIPSMLSVEGITGWGRPEQVRGRTAPDGIALLDWPEDEPFELVVTAPGYRPETLFRRANPKIEPPMMWSRPSPDSADLIVERTFELLVTP